MRRLDSGHENRKTIDRINSMRERRRYMSSNYLKLVNPRNMSRLEFMDEMDDLRRRDWYLCHSLERYGR